MASPSVTRQPLAVLSFVIRLPGVSQGEPARDLGVTKTWVNQVLLGHVRPSPRFRRDDSISVCRRLGVDATDVDNLRRCFFGDDQDLAPGSADVLRRLAEAVTA